MAENDFMAAMQQGEKSSNLNAPVLEESKFLIAERVVNAIAMVYLIFGILVLILSIILAIEAENEFFQNIGLAIGIVIFFGNLVTWSLIRILVNVSYRLTSIDQKLKQ